MKKLDFPDRITVELTNVCNVSCTFCPRNSVSMECGYMSLKLYKKIIDEASGHLPIKLVIFFRGESLLHPDFIECVEYAKKRGIGPIQFATNGFALTKEISDKLVDTGIDFISFSLDTLDPDIYSKSRLSGNLKKSIENVIYLSSLCKKRKTEGKHCPTLQVSTIDLPEYRDGQEEFIDFFKNYVDIVRVYYEHDDSGRFRDENVRKNVENSVPERRPCRKVYTDMLIYWDGNLALCNYDWCGGLKGLNANEMTLQEIWNSETYENVRGMHDMCKFSEEIMCENCEHWRIDYMPGGHLGRVYRFDDAKGRK